MKNGVLGKLLLFSVDIIWFKILCFFYFFFPPPVKSLLLETGSLYVRARLCYENLQYQSKSLSRNFYFVHRKR